MGAASVSLRKESFLICRDFKLDIKLIDLFRRQYEDIEVYNINVL